MNKQRREQLQLAIDIFNNISDQLGEAAVNIETCAAEEQECFDNLTEGLQAAERGQRMQEVAQSLQSIADELCSIDFDQYISDIEQAIE